MGNPDMSSDQDAREEFREMFAGTPGVRPAVAVTEDEIDRLFAIQTAMRAEHTRICERMDREEISVPAAFEEIGANTQAHFAQMKEILGEQRYSDIFDTTETNLFGAMADEETFIEANTNPTNPKSH